MPGPKFTPRIMTDGDRRVARELEDGMKNSHTSRTVLALERLAEFVRINQYPRETPKYNILRDFSAQWVNSNFAESTMIGALRELQYADPFDIAPSVLRVRTRGLTYALGQRNGAREVLQKDC